MIRKPEDRNNHMLLKEITHEIPLSQSDYYNLFLKESSTFVSTAFGNLKGNSHVFPSFKNSVLKSSLETISKPEELINYSEKEIPHDFVKQNKGKILIIERVDKINEKDKVRLFFVWVSQDLINNFTNNYFTPLNIKSINSIILFHPAASLEKYPKYWNGGFEKVPNYLQLGFRYLFWEKKTIAQIFFSEVQKNFKGILIVPVMSPLSYLNFTDPMEMDRLTKNISRICFINTMPIEKRKYFLEYPDVTRLAIAGYSRSGIILTNLLRRLNTKAPDFSGFANKLKEIYAFDIVTDNDQAKKATNYNHFWDDLKRWKNNDTTKKIRLYSAEPPSVSRIKAEMLLSGTYFEANFQQFNGKTINGVLYKRLQNGYEIYSKDKSISLLMLPSINFKVYLTEHNNKGEDIVHENKNGFDPDNKHELNMEGHTWFVSRLLGHSLFHSDFSK